MSDAWARLGSLSRPPAENKPLHLRQAEWLQKCLASAQDTEFGRRHGFQHIDTPQAYQEAVPLHTYNDLRPWLERVAKGVPDLLFDGLPVAFECTAGSLGGAKLIPYSREGLKDFKNALRPWLAQTITQHGIQEGSCYWVTSPALRRPGEILPGIPLGLPDAAYLGEDLHLELGRISDRKSVV